jgi:hypothetical protein
MRTYTYKGRVMRPTMKTHAGVKETRDFLNLSQIKRHCDEYLRRKGISVEPYHYERGKDNAQVEARRK